MSMQRSAISLSAFFSLLCIIAFAQPNRKAAEVNEAGLNEVIHNLPVSFRKNMGQWEEAIVYQGFSPGWDANVNFLKNGLSFGLSKMAKPVHKDPVVHQNLYEQKNLPHERLVWNLYFKGMNPHVTFVADGPQESHVNFMIGNDASKYHLNVPEYRVLQYKNVYDNIDIKYYSTGKNLKYDCLIKPGGDVAGIRMACEGIKHLQVNASKQLEITNAWGTLIEEMPESYQVINGKKVLVPVEYVVLDDTTFGFKVVGKYDRSQTLIIDPVILAWSTFVGAGGADEGYSNAVAVDPAGNVYCTGFYEANFPVTPGAFNAAAQFVQNVIVYKLNPTATTLLYATYLGSSSNDWGMGIVVNASGEAYVTGHAGAANFPTTPGAFQTVHGGSLDVFVTKLNATGTGLIYSTFIGGTGADQGYDIKINAAGEAYVTGVASKAGFPYTPGAFQTTLTAGYGALIAKLNAAGSSLIYAGILGGSLGNYGYGIAIDPAGNAYVTGETGSWANTPPSYTDFPTTPGAFKTTYGNCGWKGFVTKINPTGTAMVYSSLLGGNGNCPNTGPDCGKAIEVNAAGEAFVTGTTGSADFPTTPGAYDQTYNSGDAFITRVNAAGSGLIYSTFFGGTRAEVPCGIAVNSLNEAFISGYTSTDDGSFPVTSCAFQPVFGGQSTANISGDIFVAKFNASGNTLQYSTFVGGNSDDYQIPKIVLFGACEEEVIVNGTSHSANFPTTPGVFQPVKLNGGHDQHVVFKMKPDVHADFTYTKPPCSLTVSFVDSSYGNCVWQSGTWTPGTWLWYFGDGTTSSQQNPVHTYTALGTYTVSLVVSCPKDSISMVVNVTNSSQPVTGNTTLCNGASTVLNAGTANTYQWNTGATTSAITVTPTVSTTYSVIVDNGGCKDTIYMNVVIGTSPAVNYTVTPVLCNGTNTGGVVVTPTGGTSPYQYSWSSGQTTSAISGMPAGTYTATVTDAGGCTTTATLSITQPAALTGTLSSTPAACGGNSGVAAISVSGGTTGYTYAWNPSLAVSSAATGLIAGNYSVTVTDANGCTIAATINVASTASINATSTHATICFGQNAFLSASGGTNYSWSTGATTPGITVSPAVTSTYTAIVSSGSCWDTVTSTVVVYVAPVITAYSTTTVTAGSSVTLIAAGGSNYTWSNSDTGSVTVVSPLVTTTYCVYSSNVNCTDSACVTIYIEPIDCSYDNDRLFIPDAFSPNNDTKNDKFGVYYPNISCIKEFQFIIYDRWGEKVFEAEDMSVLWDGNYKGKPMNTAVFVYYMKATFINDEEVIRKGNISLIK